jgi:hypothetical protein
LKTSLPSFEIVTTTLTAPSMPSTAHDVIEMGVVERLSRALGFKLIH